MARGRTALAQALYRRLITPRGTLRGGREEAAYGLDVAGYVGAVGVATALAALPALVRAELCKDDRVRDVVVTATSTTMGAETAVQLEIDVAPMDEDDTFTLTLLVTDVRVELLGGLPS
jgi:hypothetical protein